MFPLEIEQLIMKYRGNIKPPHYFIYNNYLKIPRLHAKKIKRIRGILPHFI
jgi:hypothetical protein